LAKTAADSRRWVTWAWPSTWSRTLLIATTEHIGIV